MKKKCIVGIIIILFVFGVFGRNTVSAQDLSGKITLLEIVISNLVSRVEALEKRLNALEKGAPVAGNLAPPKKLIPKKEYTSPPSGSGYEDIGKGFFVKNVRFTSFGTNVLFTGEIANRSEKNAHFAKFILEIYDNNNLLYKKEEFTMPDIPKGSVKSFESMLIGIDANAIERYAIKAVE
ncbi:MAG: hypothetical protein MRJ65_00225 [Candidatus Brocadiaceae bacterium]|nr:hypothetical protein [Candidatus Brocadiaceae bacterium]